MPDFPDSEHYQKPYEEAPPPPPPPREQAIDNLSGSATLFVSRSCPPTPQNECEVRNLCIGSVRMLGQLPVTHASGSANYAEYGRLVARFPVTWDAKYSRSGIYRKSWKSG